MPSPRLLPRLLLLLVGSVLRLPGQERAPDLERIAVIVDRIETGDSTLRRDFEAEARGFLTWAAQRDVPVPTAHLVARVGFAMGAPFAHPDSAITQRETFWRRGAVRALRAALGADSGDVFSARLLEHLEPYPHVWIEPDRELAHLRALEARESLPAPLLLALLGMELERGDSSRARAILAGIDSGAIGPARWHHLAAQARFAVGDRDGRVSYYDGASRIRGTEDAAIFRQDLEWIAEPEELVGWDALAPGEHRAWLERFWQRRDLLDGRMPGTRLREHFARWRIALRDHRWDREASHAMAIPSQAAMGYEYNENDTKYPRPSHVAEGSFANRFRARNRVVDDLGAAILRHGSPTDTARFPGSTGNGQRVLGWDVPGGRLVLSFSRPALAPPNMQPDEKWGMVARNIPLGDLVAACRVDASLCALAGRAEVGNANEPGLVIQADRARERYTAMRETLESTDGNPERVATDLGAVAQVYGIPGEGVLVVFSAPPPALGTPGDSAILRLRVVVGDTASGRITTAVETERAWAMPTSLDDGSRVSGYLLLRNPAGAWRVAVAMSDTLGHAGSGMTVDAVPVLTPGSELALGDPILGREGGGLAWQRLGLRVPLNPTGAWRRDEFGVLSLEVHGLIPGRSYRLAIELQKRDARDGAAVLSVEGEFTADRAVMMVQREISFRNLDPGTYRLVARVTDPATGQQVQRERVVPIAR